MFIDSFKKAFYSPFAQNDTCSVSIFVFRCKDYLSSLFLFLLDTIVKIRENVYFAKPRQMQHYKPCTWK